RAGHQIDGEGASLTGDAGHPDLAAEEADELAADGQAEAGAAVEASGGAVALSELLEDPGLLGRVDPDPRVGDRDGHDPGGVRECRVVGGPSPGRPVDVHAHLAGF